MTWPSPTGYWSSNGHPQYRTNLQEVKRVDILGRHRIRFVFKQANNPLLILHLGELPVLPQHYWKHRDFKRHHLHPAAGQRAVPHQPGGAGPAPGV